MWNCISCEMWSAYKMKSKTLISKVVPVLKQDGKFIRNPGVHTEQYVKDGELVYGEMKTGAEGKAAKELIAKCQIDLSPLDAEVDRMVWHFTHLFPGCLQMSIDCIRQKKRFYWDQSKASNRHWLNTNMMAEAFLGFTAFNNRKLTDADQIDFVKYRQLIAEGALMDERVFEAVLPKPKG
jgi:6-oxo-cyclohex-1-ene-carbonyl-CoA hydrolase